MFSRVRTAVLSFVLASVSYALVAAETYEPRFAYQPGTGRIARVGEIKPDGRASMSLVNERTVFEDRLADWIVDVQFPEEIRYGEFLTKDFKAVYLTTQFADGAVLVGLRSGAGGYLLTSLAELTELEIERSVRDHFGLLEDGEQVTIRGLLKDGRLWVEPIGSPEAGYLRAREGVTVLGTRAEMEQQALKMVFREAAPLLEGFDPADVDLSDPLQFQLFKLYIMIRFQTPEDGFYKLDMRLDDLSRFVSQNAIPPKLLLRTLEFSTGSRTLRLRRLEPLESVFRGCLGQDCSTQTRFFRSLEPAHLNFAIEEVPYRGLGQIEVVLGKSADSPPGDPAGRLALLERIQSPKNLRERELTDLMTALSTELARQGYRLVMPADVEVYYKGHHPIANNPELGRRIQAAVTNSFELGMKHSGFDRDRDRLPNEDPRFTNLVAHYLRELGFPVFDLNPKPATIESFKSRFSVVEPVTSAVSHASRLSAIKRRIEALVDSAESRDHALSPKFWSEIHGKLFTQPCEFKVTNSRVGGDRFTRPASVH